MNAQAQQPQDVAAAAANQAAQLTFQALAAQRNELADRLAHSSVVATQLEQHGQMLAAQNAELQSRLDEVSGQLETTKAALVDTQMRASSIDAANVALTKQLDAVQKELAKYQPAAVEDPGVIPA